MDTDGNPQNADPGDGGDQTQPLGWKTELPESQRGHEAFAGYDSKKALFEGVINLHGQHKEALQKLTDTEGKLASAIVKPGENATDEERAAYLKALGVPDKAEEYELGKPEDWPQDIPFDEGLVTAFKDEALKMGIPKEQAQGMFSWYNAHIKDFFSAQRAAQEKATADALAEIKTEWGAKYEENAAIVKRVAETISGKGKEWLIAQDDPNLARLLLAAAPVFLNDNIPPGGPSHKAQTEAKAELTYPNSDMEKFGKGG